MSQKVYAFYYYSFDSLLTLIIIFNVIKDPNCTIIFTEPKPAHNDLLQKIIGDAQISGTAQPSCYQLDDEALENQNDKTIDND